MPRIPEEQISPFGRAEPDAYAIPEFCIRHRISESFYHKLQSLGLGPKTMRLLGRTLITREAAAQWRAEREAASASVSNEA